MVVLKQYGAKQRDDHRYEPPRDAEFIRKTAILGCPSFERMSTSLVERQNLTIRMHVRRLTRLCNGYSKKRRNHGAALALHFAWYNFVRVHESLRVTPAMEAGLTDHVWDVAEPVERALAEPVPEPAPLAPIPSPDGWRAPEQLGLFPGLPGVLPKLLPPSSGGTMNANDNGDDAPAAPQAPPALRAGDVGDDVGGDAAEGGEGEEEEGPATVREPAPWGAVAG